MFGGSFLHAFAKPLQSLVGIGVVDAHRGTELAAVREEGFQLRVDVARDVFDVVRLVCLKEQKRLGPVRRLFERAGPSRLRFTDGRGARTTSQG